MAIESWGYFNEVTPGVTAARVFTYAAGTRYWAYNQDSVRVTPLIGGTREIQISPGEFGCYGIHNRNTSVATLQLPTPSQGTQWYLICARHTWADGESATTFIALHCGSIAQLPAGRRTDPGDVIDQPLAYVPITVGQTNPGTPIDMRALGTGKDDVLINSEYALSYLQVAGMRCRLGNIEYSRVLNAAGTAHQWLINRGPFGRNAISEASSSWGTSDTGWTTGSLISRAIRDGNTVDLTLRTRRTLANVPVSATGHVADVRMFKTTPEWRPSITVYAACSYTNQDQSNSMGLVSLDPNGDIWFLAGTPNRHLRQMPPGQWSLSCSFTFIQTGA